MRNSVCYSSATEYCIFISIHRKHESLVFNLIILSYNPESKSDPFHYIYTRFHKCKKKKKEEKMLFQECLINQSICLDFHLIYLYLAQIITIRRNERKKGIFIYMYKKHIYIYEVHSNFM